MCNGITMYGNNNTLENCEVFNTANDGLILRGRYHVVKGNKIHTLHGCGTDGGCGNCFNGHRYDKHIVVELCLSITVTVFRCI